MNRNNTEEVNVKIEWSGWDNDGNPIIKDQKGNPIRLQKDTTPKSKETIYINENGQRTVDTRFVDEVKINTLVPSMDVRYSLDYGPDWISSKGLVSVVNSMPPLKPTLENGATFNGWLKDGKPIDDSLQFKDLDGSALEISASISSSLLNVPCTVTHDRTGTNLSIEDSFLDKFKAYYKSSQGEITYFKKEEIIHLDYAPNKVWRVYVESPYPNITISGSLIGMISKLPEEISLDRFNFDNAKLERYTNYGDENTHFCALSGVQFPDGIEIVKVIYTYDDGTTSTRLINSGSWLDIIKKPNVFTEKEDLDKVSNITGIYLIDDDKSDSSEIISHLDEYTNVADALLRPYYYEPPVRGVDFEVYKETVASGVRFKIEKEGASGKDYKLVYAYYDEARSTFRINYLVNMVVTDNAFDYFWVVPADSEIPYVDKRCLIKIEEF